MWCTDINELEDDMLVAACSGLVLLPVIWGRKTEIGGEREKKKRERESEKEYIRSRPLVSIYTARFILPQK